MKRTKAVKPNLAIFVVEDHDDTRIVLCDLLRDWGHDVRCATSVLDATEALSLRPGDVLLSDIKLPDADGWELIGRLGKHVPGYAIAMSGYGTAADRERSLSAGYRDHLVKPFDVDALQQLLVAAALELDFGRLVDATSATPRHGLYRTSAEPVVDGEGASSDMWTAELLARIGLLDHVISQQMGQIALARDTGWDATTSEDRLKLFQACRQHCVALLQQVLIEARLPLRWDDLDPDVETDSDFNAFVRRVH
jgi:CheY-like chemotaxis protein